MVCFSQKAKAVSKRTRIPPFRFALTLVVTAWASMAFNSTHSNAAELTAEHFTSFYQTTPFEVVPGMILEWENGGMFDDPNTSWSLVGFLTGLFHDYPDRNEDWISGNFTPNTMKYIVMALTLAGQTDQARVYVEQRNLPTTTRALIDGMPTDLNKIQIDSTQTLDLLWGASFATGRPQYTNLIMDMALQLIASGKYDVEDIITLSEVLQNPRNADGKYLVPKYGQQGVFDFLPTSTALWALGSNAKRHSFIRDALKKRLATTQPPDSIYALEYALFQATSKIAGKTENDVVQVTLSGSAQREVVEEASRVGDVATIAETFQVEFAKDEPVNIVTMMYLKVPAELYYLLVIEGPDGAETKIGPLTISGSRGIYVGTDPIPADRLKKRGLYTIESLFTDGPSNFEAQTRFFLR